VKGSELFADLPQAADPSSQRNQLADHPDNHHAIFGLAEQLSELLPEATQPEEDAATLAGASIAVHSVNWRIYDILPSAGSDIDTPAKSRYEATGLPTASVCKALETSIVGAELLNNLTARLYQEEATPGEATPIIDWLTARQHSPDEARMLMQTLREKILSDVGETGEKLAYLLLEIFGIDTAERYKREGEDADRKIAEFVHQNDKFDNKAEELADQDASKSIGVEHLLMTVRQEGFSMPLITIGNVPALKLVKTISSTYRRRQRILRERPPMQLPDRENPKDIRRATLLNAWRATATETATEFANDSTAAYIATYQDGLADLIYTHRQRVLALLGSNPDTFNANPSGLEFALKQQRLLEVRGDRHGLTRARIIGLMAGFAEIGPRADEPHEFIQKDVEDRLTMLFTFEHAVNANLKKGAAVLRAAGVTANLNGWQPLEPDAVLLNKHWRSLLPTVREKWPNDEGQGAVTAITNALRAFKAYHEEFADPESRLIMIATHLGATVLRPERRAKGTTLEASQRQQAISDLLEGIASDEQLELNKRYRAQVLQHFMGDDAQTPAQGAQPAELFYIPPTKKQLTPYFCINFRSSESKDWVLLESLRYGKASYVFPQELVEREGNDVTLEELEEFLDRYDKSQLMQNGGIRVIHVDGWTPASHIAEIRGKVAAADGFGAI
jgi:hypothetical protein